MKYEVHLYVVVDVDDDADDSLVCSTALDLLKKGYGMMDYEEVP